VLRMTRKPNGGLLQVSDDPFDRRVYEFPAEARQKVDRDDVPLGR
jgi:hypothetical protein